MLPADIAAAMDRSVAAYWGAYGLAEGGLQESTPAFLFAASTIPHPMFNTVILTEPDMVAVEAALGRAAANRSRTGIPVLWRVTAAAATDEVRGRLEAAGLASLGGNPAMAIDIDEMPDKPPVTGLKIVTAEGAAERGDWARLACRGFELSAEVGEAMGTCEASIPEGLFAGQPRYIGYFDGEPVAASSLVMTGKTAGVYAVATLPEMRRRGIGTAMTLHAMQEGGRAGASHAVRQASDIGRPVYEAIGFRTIFDYALYVQS